MLILLVIALFTKNFIFFYFSGGFLSLSTGFGFFIENVNEFFEKIS